MSVFRRSLGPNSDGHILICGGCRVNPRRLRMHVDRFLDGRMTTSVVLREHFLQPVRDYTDIICQYDLSILGNNGLCRYGVAQDGGDPCSDLMI